MLTTSFSPGVPCWVDLGTPDIQASASFYGALFGWTYQSAGPDAGGYGFLQLNGKTVAAIGPLTEEGAGPSWTLYFHTADADATTKAVEQAGGTVRFPPDDVFTAGRMAGFTDPTGARFAVWQPGDTKGLDAVTDVGTLCWTELYTSDAAAAKEFYSSVFSWELQDMPIPGGMTYTVAGPPGSGQEGQHSGIMQHVPEQVESVTTSAWHPYFEVEDCDATATAAEQKGATVLVAPMDMEGVGRMAMFLDPHGAYFSVITSSS